jgi:hypothetical protein
MRLKGQFDKTFSCDALDQNLSDMLHIQKLIPDTANIEILHKAYKYMQQWTHIDRLPRLLFKFLHLFSSFKLLDFLFTHHNRRRINNFAAASQVFKQRDPLRLDCLCCPASPASSSHVLVATWRPAAAEATGPHLL